ncbi:MAG: aminotransferase class IV [Planctomycetota bacterium]|jgi:branched-subunit amino acid aminotransferase/4-amino-4-deoxychorismate lyase
MNPRFDPHGDRADWPGVLDGELLAAHAARLPLHNDAFLLGRAVFTTARWRAGRLEFFGEHVARLRRHALAAQLVASDAALPSSEDFQRDLSNLTPALDGLDAALRWTLFPTDAGVSRWLSVRPLPTAPAEGIALARADAPFERHPAEALKHTGRLAKHLERERARARGAHDAYGVSRAGEVLSASAGCLLWITGERAFTPATHGGLLDSVVRGALLAAGAVSEGHLEVRDLDVPSELLWANSLHGVLPVLQLEGRARPLPGPAGPAFRGLSERLEGLIRAS